MAGLRGFFIGASLLTVFVLALIGFTVSFLTSNNPTSPALNSTFKLTESFNSMNASASTITHNANILMNDLRKESPIQTALFSVFLIFAGAFYIPWKLLDIVYSLFVTFVNIIFPGLDAVGGGMAVGVVASLLLSMISVTVVLLIIKAIRTGESER